MFIAKMEIVFEASEPQQATLVFLHGFGMSAEDMSIDLAPVAAQLPWLRIIVPEAPVVPVTAYGGDEYRSWFDYLTDREGKTEDAIDAATLRAARNSIQTILWREHKYAKKRSVVTPPKIIIGGMSQGGCLALDVATRERQLTAVVTSVAHRLYLSRTRPLLCRWHALFAENDDVFPLSWAAPTSADNVHFTLAEASDHYIANDEFVPFVVKSIQAAMIITSVVTDDAQETAPSLQ